MATFNGHTVTNDGRNLLGRALSGAGKIVFTKAAFGQGTYTGDLREIKELVDKRLDCVVSDILNDQGTVNIKIQITNKNLTQSFRTEEFGIYAKIEGDATEILYCYAAAQESDSIPNNSFGDTFMAEHTVYLAFSSDAEADIYIKEGAVFLTRDTADKSYVIIDLEAKGDLSSGRTSLEADKIYKADDGKWYKNIGGDRSWMSGNGVPDELLKLISWEQIYKDLDKPFGTNKGEILEGHRLAQALGLEFAGELNNNDLKQAGKAYWDNVNKSIYKCLVNTTLNYADASYFEALSNNDLLLKLQNLPKIYTSSYGDYTSSFNGFIKELGIFTYQSAPDLPLGKHEVKYTAPIGFIILCAWVNWKDNIKVNSYIGLDYERNDTYITVAYHAENTSMSYTVTLLCAKI